MAAYLMEFDVSREEAEARMVMGSAFPGEFDSILCVQNASLVRSGESLALARMQSALTFPLAAKQMSRLFGPRGSAARQDVLLAADVDSVTEEESDLAARAAYGQAK